MRDLTVGSAAPGSEARSEVPRFQPATRRLARAGALLLCAVIGLAASLRLWNLGGVGFRGDEAVYAGQSAVLSGAQAMRRHFILLSRGNSNFLLYQHAVALVFR